MEANTSLSAADLEHATRQGWHLVEVWVPEKKRLVLEIHPLHFEGPNIKSMPQAYAWLWDKGRKGDLVAQRALRLIATYGQKKK